MTVLEKLEHASAKGLRVRLFIAGEELVGRPCVIVERRVVLFAIGNAKVPTRALFIAAIERCEVIR